jgi:predicted enzyme related to lactoylglutathione lyase
MDATVNTLNWFEVSVADLARAKAFYETVFDIQLYDLILPELQMALFPSQPGNGKLSGALAKSASHIPSGDGAIVYFNANPDLSVSLARVEGAGGKVLLPKTLISPENGYMAFIMDTEGNKVGIHSNA